MCSGAFGLAHLVWQPSQVRPRLHADATSAMAGPAAVALSKGMWVY
jgi:hypothetical protein